MRVRVILSTIAAMAAAGGFAFATADSGTATVAGALRSASTPATMPGTKKAITKPLSRADRAAIKSARSAQFPKRDARTDFSVLRRPSRHGDRLKRAAAISAAVGAMEFSDARLVISDALGAVRAVPTDREVCVSTTYGNGRSKGATDACIPSAVASQTGAWTVTQCSSDRWPQARFIAGVVPDDVRSVRATTNAVDVAVVAPTDNGFQIEVRVPVEALEFVTDGEVREVRLPPVEC